MILSLTKDSFVNNMFKQLTDGGCIAVFNCVQEHCKSNTEYPDCIVNSINIEVHQIVNNVKYYVSCPCIIGMGDEFIKINSNHKELLGSPLTLDNIDKCTFELSDLSIYNFL